MKQQFVLTGEPGAYRVVDGTARLFAVTIIDGKPVGRLHYFKTVKEQESFTDFCAIDTKGHTWACFVRYTGPSGCVPIDVGEANSDTCEEFGQFIKALEVALAGESDRLESRKRYSHQVMDQAVTQLKDVNQGLEKWSWKEFDNSNEQIEVCKVLCNYLKVEAHVPTKDVAEKFSNLSEEILYLSGIRYKEFSLAENWWKHSNGAMMGQLKDGTPIALLPRKTRGYRAYDPKKNTTFPVDKEYAENIKPTATAVFRTFPAKSIGYKDVIAFMLGENIYKEIGIIILCSFLANIIQVIPSIVSTQIFDVIVPENLPGMLVEVILLLIAFELANIGFYIITNLGISRINTKVGLSIQAALWDRLLSLRTPFFGKYTAGEILQKIKGVDEARKMISMDTLQVVFSNLFFFVYIITLFNFNAAITPYVLAMFVGQIIVYAVAGKVKYSLYKSHMELENKSMSFNHQCMLGMHRVKVSCAEERIYSIWSGFEAGKYRAKSRIKMIDNGLGAFQLFFDFASTAVVYFLISRNHDVAMGVFVAYVSTFLICQKSMRKLLKVSGILPELLSIFKNVKPILKEESEYSTFKTIPSNMTGTLEVNHATFRYEKYSPDIIKDVSFRVEEGETLGIVGLSGGGKTTLLKILMGFYELTSGKIYYGGYDLETIDLRYLRKQMGVVLQNGRLIVGDIYSNVADNDPAVEPKAVMDALRMVGLDTMVAELPDGVYTKLEHHPLSDGERQRLLIARAIAKKNKFLFLDEATSNLDNISQNKILHSLRKIPATKLIIAQRLETVKFCDKIIVIQKGKIVEQGTYDQVANGSGFFHQLVGQA